MNFVDCHCDNGFNCIHQQHLRSPEPSQTISESISSDQDHLTSPAYSPTSPAYSPTSTKSESSKLNGKRKIDVIDLTKDEYAKKNCKVRRKNNEIIQNNFECPITHCFMTDPVVDILGHTYQRDALQQWLKKKLTSPLTGEDYLKILQKRKMGSKRDRKSLVREKIIVGKNFSMINDPSWIVLSKT